MTGRFNGYFFLLLPCSSCVFTTKRIHFFLTNLLQRRRDYINRKRWIALGLTLLFSCSALPAASAAYADMDYTHWAYSLVNHAERLGVIQGVGNNCMDPSGTLTWGQFLTLLSRTVAHKQYDANAQIYPWDTAGYMTVLEAGLLSAGDQLLVSPDGLDQPITRQDAALLLAEAIPDGDVLHPSASWLWYEDDGEQPDPEDVFSDWDEMDEVHQDAVAELYRLKIVSGKSDGSFGYADTIQRADGTVLLMRMLNQLEGSVYGEETDITVHFVDGNGASIGPDCLVSGPIGYALASYDSEISDAMPDDYTSADTSITYFSLASSDFTVVCRLKTEFERQQSAFWDLVDQGLASEEDYWSQDFWLIAPGGNSAKRTLLFDDSDKSRFANREEAEANMVTVTVPVWRLSNGKKVSGTASFSIHADLAQDVTEIFTEIYNDPEQFPICDVGGYSWRGDTATGEHNCGTAIDINSNQNYQVRDGAAMVGSHWTPGADPYSISPTGSVVRIFTEHGWTWGGTAWADSSDASYGYHDYMHFSYMGG